MMSTRQALYLTLRSEDDIASLPAHLLDRVGEDVTLEIAGAAAELQDAAIFRKLSDLAQQFHVRMRVETEDPVCKELASIFGLTGRIGSYRPPAKDQPDKELHDQPTTVRAEDTVPGSPSVENHADEATRKSFDFFDSESSYSWVINPPVPRRPDLQADYGHGIRRRGRSRRGRRKGAIVAGSTLMAALLLIAAAIVILPSATVAVVPETRPVDETVTYGVAGAAVPLEVTISPREVSAPVQFEATIPTTGERFEPDGTASGVVSLSNAATEERLLPAGTVLASAVEGITFVTTEDVLVPAADPFGSQSFGAASVPVVAQQPGPASNLSPGQVAGQIDARLFYTNREALSGGTERRIAVVSEADIQRLTTDAQTALQQQAQGALQSGLQDQEQLIASSITVGEPQLTFSHQAGADAAEVTIKATATVSAQAYDAEELQRMANAAAIEQLRSAAPAGYELQPSTVSMGAPKPLTEEGPPAFEVDVRATSGATISDDEQAAMRDAVRGKGGSDAQAALDRLPGIGSASVEIGPSWLPIELPARLDSRVDVRIVEKTTATPGS